MAARPPAPPPGSTTCPSCGWANAASATVCEFCKMPFATRPRPSDTRPASAGPPSPPPVKEVSELAESWDNLKERLRPSPHVLVVALIMTGAMMGFCVQYRYNMKATTADHIRQIKRALQIYEGENGGYPATLQGLQQRGMMAPAYVLKDAWSRDIVYTVAKPRAAGQFGDVPETLYQHCEVRSHGSNGKPGDDDDVVWTGNAQ